ncbi:hypothetical protein HU200_052229 [Digitaria exilis]|uniref:FBD domain-containing protein n=1 Tax=Digitaria exilis TaxID=1010633 RepID=A0A835AP22_9POAL|nr:hypothetical protein HU200_052229 [Digitaria exilis]
MKHNIPCTLFSEGVRNSIRWLQLSLCALHPTAELGPFRKLTRYFLYNSPALEKLDLSECQEIMCLKIPCVLLQLHFLKVSYCFKLQVIESKARNLFSFSLTGTRGTVKVSLGETMQMKNLCMCRSDLIYYARSELPSNMPNLETLTIGSPKERVDTPMLPTKFLFLKHLSISLTLSFCPSYDFFSLASFLVASPSLEMRQMPEQHHRCLKTLKIKGFHSAKSLVELTCYILKNTKSLECLTLDTTYGQCAPMNEGFLAEARRGAAAIRTYIEDIVPSTVKLTVVEHCRRCHADSYPNIGAAWNNF